MSNSVITERRRIRRSVAVAGWGIAGAIVLIAFGDLVAVLAVALVLVIVALWMYGGVDHNAQGDDAEMAPVTPLRPSFVGRRDVQQTSPRLRGPRAA